jgi:hypothetical protein
MTPRVSSDSTATEPKEVPSRQKALREHRARGGVAPIIGTVNWVTKSRWL